MEGNGLNRYLDEIGQSQLLSETEERQLSERIKAGDQRAIGKLVEANLRFVVKIAAQYRGQGIDFDDLISEGNLGLMKAAAKFDADRGIRFVNYAVIHIRRQIEKCLPTATPDQRAASPAPAAEKARETASLDAPLGHRSNMSLLAVLVNQDAPQADERTYSEAIERAIDVALLTLSERESRVVNAFFGINQEHETMAEIAEDMGLRRERVRQIRDRAVRRLKKTYKKELKELRK